MVKFYSDQTNKFYTTMDELTEAEKALAAKREADEKARKEREAAEAKARHEREEADKKKADERKARAAEVKDAYDKYVAARKEYTDKLNKFVKDYNSYHCSLTTTDVNDWKSMKDVFDSFCNWWF